MEPHRDDVRGVWIRGSDPKELVLSDGSRLLLEPGALDGGRVGWRRTDGREETATGVSVPEAFELAGDDYSDYVSVRTRAEAEWLRAIADWCTTEAGRLDHELGMASA
jgi:hypothetical protein